MNRLALKLSPALRAPRLLSALVCLTLLTTLSACGGSGPAKSEMTKAVSALEGARKTRCPHKSLPLAEKAYEDSKRLFDEGKYDEARAKARVAQHLSAEVLKSNGGKPCEAPSEVKSEGESELFVPETNPPEDVVAAEVPEMETVYFAFDSAQLSPETMQTLELNLNWIRQNGESRIELGGHCDSRGSSDYNIALSERRASAVEGYLLKSGVAPERLEVVAYGSEQPASYRQDSAGHKLNRRVEFKAR